MKFFTVVAISTTAAVAATGGVVGADAKPFAWVPSEACEAPLKLCYQGEEATLLQVSKVDVFNLCREQAQILPGTCAEHGYETKVGTDPIFQNLVLYRHKTSNIRGQKINGITHALELLSNEDDQGVCWKDVSFRRGRFGNDCASDEDEQFGVCYPKCKDDAEGLGPICLAQCGGDYAESAGLICCKTSEDCSTTIREESFKLLLDITKAIMDRENTQQLIQDLKKLFVDAQGLDFPKCSESSPFSF